MSNNNLPLTTVDHENGINNERKFSQQIEINSKTQPKNPLEDNTVLQLILSYLYEGREDSLTLVRFGGVCKKWEKIMNDQKLWKPAVVILQMRLGIEEDFNEKQAREYFMKLKRKQIGVEFSITEYFGSYCKLSCNNQKFRTKLISKTQNPEFNETFE